MDEFSFMWGFDNTYATWWLVLCRDGEPFLAFHPLAREKNAFRDTFSRWADGPDFEHRVEIVDARRLPEDGPGSAVMLSQRDEFRDRALRARSALEHARRAFEAGNADELRRILVANTTFIRGDRKQQEDHEEPEPA